MLKWVTKKNKKRGRRGTLALAPPPTLVTPLWYKNIIDRLTLFALAKKCTFICLFALPTFTFVRYVHLFVNLHCKLTESALIVYMHSKNWRIIPELMGSAFVCLFAHPNWELVNMFYIIYIYYVHCTGTLYRYTVHVQVQWYRYTRLLHCTGTGSCTVKVQVHCTFTQVQVQWYR